MENKDHRRKSKRYPVRWKAAVVFDKADGKPILHTQTQDMSVGGTAIHSSYADLTGSIVTLLLASPLRRSGEVQKMLKVRARVVSTVKSPSMSDFRHGMSFVQQKDDDLNILVELLGVAEAASPDGKSIAEVPPTAMPAAIVSAPVGSSRLARLKQLALAKQSEQIKGDPQEEINTRVSGALEKAFRYLKEFTEQLNFVRPAYAKGYSIVGVPNFDGLIWEDGSINCRVRETSPKNKLYEQVSLHFRLSANRQLRVTRESPMHEKLKQLLLENNIDFTTQEEYNERGSLVRMTFVLPCVVKASLQLVGQFDTGKVVLKTRNIERFGMLEHLLDPGAITEESLDEFTGFILGESSRIGPLLLKNTIGNGGDRQREGEGQQ